MKNFFTARRTAAVCILLSVMLMCTAPASAAASDMPVSDSIASVTSWYLNDSDWDYHDAGTSPSGDWFAFCLGRLGKTEQTKDYIRTLQDYVSDAYDTADKLDSVRATEWHRICLTLEANGVLPSKALLSDGTYNRGLTAPLNMQGTNAPIWALLTLDSFSYEIPADAADTRESIIRMILDAQLEDGSFALNAGQSAASIDITANALTALAPYYQTGKEDASLSPALLARVRVSVDAALLFLSSVQLENGGYADMDATSSESCAQVLTALCSLSISPESDARFIKNGHTVLDALLSFQNSDGGFAHSAADKSSSIASVQALSALCSYQLAAQEETRLFDLNGLCTNQTENENRKETSPFLPILIVILLLTAGVLFFLHKRKTYRPDK